MLYSCGKFICIKVMEQKKIEYILSEIKQLTPFEKGKLFSLFLLQEKSEMKGSRKELRDSIKWSKEITDEDIQSCLYNPNLDDIIR